MKRNKKFTLSSTIAILLLMVLAAFAIPKLQASASTGGWERHGDDCDDGGHKCVVWTGEGRRNFCCEAALPMGPSHPMCERLQDPH